MTGAFIMLCCGLAQVSAAASACVQPLPCRIVCVVIMLWCGLVQVSAAALACVKSLTCSMKCLWDINTDELTPAVVRLLSHPEASLRCTALKTLSNLLLDAEHVKVGSTASNTP